MNALIAPDSPHASYALSGVLRAKGFEIADFEFEDDAAPGLSDLFGVRGALLRVRCCSTGEERMYHTGLGSAWLGAFLMDLGGGHFSRAARGVAPVLG
jgi:hypothetical protein